VKLERLKRIMAQTSVLTMTLGAILVATAAPAQAGTYVSMYAAHSTLQNIAKSWTAIFPEGEDANYGALRHYSSAGGYMEWVIQDHAPNGHTIQEEHGRGRCLDSNSAGNAYGIPCNGGQYQRWDFIYEGKMTDSYYQRSWDVYTIVDRATGRCLDGNGVVGYTLGCNGGAYQRWFLININE
jgi:serine/threonine-protein kinase